MSTFALLVQLQERCLVGLPPNFDACPASNWYRCVARGMHVPGTNVGTVCLYCSLQVAHYPSQIVSPGPDNLRKKAHVDSGTITLLVSQDWEDGSAWTPGDGGLQLMNANGQWQEVAVPQGTPQAGSFIWRAHCRHTSCRHLVNTTSHSKIYGPLSWRVRLAQLRQQLHSFKTCCTWLHHAGALLLNLGSLMMRWTNGVYTRAQIETRWLQAFL